MADRILKVSTSEIIAARGPRNPVQADRAYHVFTEQERDCDGKIVSAAVLLLTNRECPFKCLMCDLWKNTLETTVPAGAIPQQIQTGLAELPDCNVIKLYNSGNFFDPKAIPPADFEEIARLVSGFERVVVECHPLLCNETCLTFRDMIAPAQLEIALGLETCHEELLAALNKQMTLENFSQAVERLNRWGIPSRAFLLLKPPFLEEAEAIEWTLKSIDFAFESGIGSVAVIPTRAGNGVMEQLRQRGDFSPPLGSSLETVLDRALSHQHKGPVTVDLWDAERFFKCDHCSQARVSRLLRMNLEQIVLNPVDCQFCGEP